jgi:cysteine desulfurase
MRVVATASTKTVPAYAPSSRTRRSKSPTSSLAAVPGVGAVMKLFRKTPSYPGIGEPLRGEIFDRGCVYLDYNATTPIWPEVAAEMAPFLFEHFGNPSSGHAFATPCRDAVALARRRVAAMLGCKDDEVVFTSCGSESDNFAIDGAVRAWRAKRRGTSSDAKPKVVATAIEHPAVIEHLKAKAEFGELTYELVGVDDEGVVRVEDVTRAMEDENVCLVTVMQANNETGAIQPIAAIAAEAKKRGILIHTDSAQSCGKIPVKVDALNVDMVTIVGHKIGAPKGVAALYIREGTDLGGAKPFYGGGQESGRRAGTENVLHIVGLGKACEIVEREMDECPAHLKAMRDDLQKRLVDALGGPDGSGVRINSPKDDAKRLPNTLNIGIKGMLASISLMELSGAMAASAGAACHTGDVAAAAGGAATVSSVLEAMAVPMDYAVGTLRLSVGRHTTQKDVEMGAALLIEAARRQVK